MVSKDSIIEPFLYPLSRATASLFSHYETTGATIDDHLWFHSVMLKLFCCAFKTFNRWYSLQNCCAEALLFVELIHIQHYCKIFAASLHEIGWNYDSSLTRLHTTVQRLGNYHGVQAILIQIFPRYCTQATIAASSIQPLGNGIPAGSNRYIPRYK